MVKIVPISAHGLIVDLPIDIELKTDQIINLEHLNELKHTLIRENLKSLVIT